MRRRATAAAILALSACNPTETAVQAHPTLPPTTQELPPPPSLPPTPTTPRHRGLATWYARGYRTASGEIFNPNAMTAAHLTLPFGTMVEVCHGAKCVVVRINDRGPARWTGNVIDLSRAAFSQLAMLGRGKILVDWRVL